MLYSVIMQASVASDYLNLILDKLVGLGERILAAVAIYFIGSWIISLLKKLVSRILERKNVDPAVSTFVRSLTNMLLRVILVVFIIGALGIQTTSLAAILAAGGFAIGMAMKDNLSNFAGGVMLLINKPFKINDHIVAQSMDGIVQEIGILYTIMLTADGRTIYIPNGPLSTGSIINYSTQDNRRIDLTYNVNYGNDADSLKKLLEGIIENTSLIIRNPAPFIGVTAIQNGNFDITIRVWVANGNYGSVSVSLNEDVYRTFSKEGIFTASSLTIKMADSTKK